MVSWARRASRAALASSYEYTVGNEIRQNFQCAVVHWQALPGNAAKTWSKNTCA
ncbi:hypothetical protein [Streptomyces sp. H-KF8]|uniref:hypothetical protein n=1 Tax=Streptomyces sp. H-KF8 TaxID=1727216 RepID=UPI00133125C6|nr:hypothetical protein [Streptomyces sp. H-KF8]